MHIPPAPHEDPLRNYVEERLPTCIMCSTLLAVVRHRVMPVHLHFGHQVRPRIHLAVLMPCFAVRRSLIVPQFEFVARYL